MKPGMIKVSAIYPTKEGGTFDIDYYCNKHTPMVAELIGSALKGSAVEHGLGSAEPGAPAPFAAIGCMYFDTFEDFQNSFGPNAEQIMGDIPNYTNIEPVIQISEVKV